jgi:hypothetical protein
MYPVFTDEAGNGMIMFFPYAVCAPFGGVRKVNTAYARVVNYAYGIFNGPDGGNPNFAGGALFDPETGYYTHQYITAAYGP